MDELFDGDDIEARRLRSTRLGGIAIPFGLVGAYGGWVVTRLERVLWGEPPGNVAALGAASGAGAGVACGLIIIFVVRGQLQRGFDAPVLRSLLLMVPVAGPLAALTTGLAVCGVEHVSSIASGKVFLIGLGGALALVPLCWVIAHAVIRAGRARLGSLVAAADRRSVWGLTAAALAITSAVDSTAGLAITSARDHEWVVRGDWWPTISDYATVWATSTVAAAALATALSVHRDDLVARRRLATIVERLAGIEPGEGELVDGAADLIDLGLGDDRRVERVGGRSAYRHPTQVVAEVVGDPESAASALERVAQRSRAAATVATLVLGAHLVFLALALPTALRGVRLIP